MSESAAPDVVRAERISFDAMVEALGAAGDQFVTMLRTLDPGDGPRPVPNLTWTVGETAAHMLTIVRRGTGDRRRSDSRAGLAELNEQSLADVDTRIPAELATLIEAEMTRLKGLLGGITAERATSTVVRLHAGLHTDIPSAFSYVLFDFLGHGYDITRATGRDWDIHPAHAALDLHACLPILGPWVKQSILDGPNLRQALSFPGDRDAIVVEAGGGRYRAQNESRDEVADVAEVDPAATFLALAGRAPAAEAAAESLAEWFEPI